MNSTPKIKLGDAIYKDIDDNDYLNELYKNILYNYAVTILNIGNIRQLREININDALRFADLLSNSTHSEKADKHKIWAQEIITLLLALYPEDAIVRYYAGAVLTSTGNHMGLDIVKSDYAASTTMDKVFAAVKDIYLTIPADKSKKFFNAQKKIYDHLKDDSFSFSAPTSLGKSFVMRMFIKGQIIEGIKNNYAIIVPTKALINEVRSEIIDKDLKDLLKEKKYHVVSAASDMELEIHPKHNFILVLTPERLLYLLNDKPDFVLDYVFVDEAHKLTGRNSRAPFYYSLIDTLNRKEKQPHIIFASPSIPNPDEFLRILTSGEEDKTKSFASSYSPVAQFKFLVNLKKGQIYIYNDHLKTQEYVCAINSGVDYGVVPLMANFDRQQTPGKPCRMIAYFSGKDKAISAAREFSKYRGQLNDSDLNELANDVKNQVHNDYYLVDLLKKGIAYHIGYLPTSIRARIESLYKDGKITAMFCTSTLVEGVNLPADNLFITSYYSGRSQMSDVDFRNLIGRVGRIQFNLGGNVFMLSDETRNNRQDNYFERLKEDIAPQKLSIEKDLAPKYKKFVLENLLSGDPEIRPYDKTQTPQPEEEYVMMRKFGLEALKDIVDDNPSLVRKEFEKYMKPGDLETIKSHFVEYKPIMDNDINISIDQTLALHKEIVDDPNFVFPAQVDGGFVMEDVVRFLERLGDVFNWKLYERNTLGKTDESGNYTKLRWYAVILIRWMEGKGLGHIMRNAIRYQENNPEKFWINKYTKIPYEKNNLDHRNIVFANTLEVIENIILFSLSNYFLRFSNEYKKVYGENSLDGINWYEFVEYGTTNEITIQLQRYGFSRESANFIRDRQDRYVEMVGGQVKIKNSISQCGDNGVMDQFINELSEKYHILEIAVDRWNATMLIQNLEGDGFTMVPFGQGYSSMSPPSKEFYKLLMEGQIIHAGNPVMRWMAGNVVIDTDPAGNIKPTKARSAEKIDGIVAAIMALDRCVRNESNRGSVYDERPIFVF